MPWRPTKRRSTVDSVASTNSDVTVVDSDTAARSKPWIKLVHRCKKSTVSLSDGHVTAEIKKWPFADPEPADTRTKFSSSDVGLFSIASLGLETMVNVGEALNIPYLKGFAGLVQLIVQTAQNVKNNKQAFMHLSDRVREMALSIAAYIDDKDADISPRFINDIQTLNFTLNRVLLVMKKRAKRKWVLQFINAGVDSDVLDGCEAELTHALNLFGLKSHIGTQAKLARRETEVEKHHQVIMEVLHSAQKEKFDENVVIESPVSATPAPSLDANWNVPSSPKIVYGRNRELEHLLDTIHQGPARVSICGPVGVGKSTLALCLLHHKEVKRHFGNRRLLVDCDAVSSFDDFIFLIAGHLGIATDRQKAPSLILGRHIVGALVGESILVLDNFESVWEPFESRLSVESFLTILSEIPQLSLIITMRGTERPCGPEWTRPFLSPLEPLDHVSARSTFLDISDISPTDPDLDAVLALTDNLPLALSLFAQCAQSEPLHALIGLYTASGGTLISRGTGRCRCLASAFESALNSPRMSACPTAVPLLRSIARSPRGVPVSSLSADASALCVLRQAALIHEDAGRVHVLAPLRVYICV